MTTQTLKIELLAALSTSTMMVKFTKKDGTVRDMSCTLQESLLPEASTIPTNTTDVLTVFDTVKSAWRSFDVSSVLSHSAI